MIMEQFQHMLESVKNTDQGAAAFERNAQNQQVGFDLANGQGFTLHLRAQSTETALTPGVPEYQRFHTTIFEFKEDVLRSLIQGRTFFSEPYLEGDIIVKGSPGIKGLIALVFRVNKEMGATADTRADTRLEA